MSSAPPSVTRRRALRALAATAGVATTGGCLDQLRSVAGRDAGDRITIDIKAVPADEDPLAIAIARALAENLDAVGIATRVTPVAIEELYRQVLINNEFDLYVGRYPATSAIDPDQLYQLLHSRFTSEAGWQNPFGCTDLTVDDLLERQRSATGQRRRAVVRELQRAVVDLMPFSVLVFPDDLSAVRVGRYRGWLGETDGFDTPHGLLALDRAAADATPEEAAVGAPGRLRLATTDGRITENWNPIAAEFRDSGLFTGLLYDSLARPYGDGVGPWLATDLWWAGADPPRTTADQWPVETETPSAADGTATPADAEAVRSPGPGNGTATTGDAGTPRETGTGDPATATPTPGPSSRGTSTAANATAGNATAGNGTATNATPEETRRPTVTFTPSATGQATATLRLREGLTWHDGEPLTADDVVFTFAFLKDTSMGELDSPVPAPRFRGRSSLVASVRASDDRTVTFQFATSNRRVASRALTVPILPEHVWTERTGEVNVPGFATEGLTEALVWPNPDPVGSGPLTFESATADESVRFTRFAEHFLSADDPPADVPARFHGKPAFDELVVQRAPSGSTAVELATAGDVDATVSRLAPATVPRIGRSDDLRLVSSRSWSFYHLGFNMRRAPLSNPRFRAAVSRVVDAGTLATEQFGGYARPAVTPLAGTEWEAPALRWSAETRDVHFHGRDGELDAVRAREAFRQAGYRYDEEGRLRN